jgi:putative hydrolase
MAAQASLTNADLAELLAQEAEQQVGIRQRAFRRATRAAFLWPEEAADLVARGGSLGELKGIGPYLSAQVTKWLESPPPKISPPPLRRDFLTLAKARRILAATPGWAERLCGDLQMHTQWSDGSGRVAEMASAAEESAYQYIAITDHSKGLKLPVESMRTRSRNKAPRLRPGTPSTPTASCGCCGRSR